MSYPPDPNNPYAKQPEQPGYGYPQQPPAPQAPQQPYGYPQQGVPPQGAPQDPYAQPDPYAQQPQQQGYGYPQQPPAQQPYGYPQQGGYPQQPPLPSYGGYQDPYGAYGQQGAGAYGSWIARVGAYLIDHIVVGLIPYIIAFAAFGPSTTINADGTVTSSGMGTYYLAILLANLVTAAGVALMKVNMGQSLGQKATNLRMVRVADGQPLTFGPAFGREVAHILDSAVCALGFLWPLWDDKNQTWADKIVGTVVIRTQ